MSKHFVGYRKVARVCCDEHVALSGSFFFRLTFELRLRVPPRFLKGENMVKQRFYYSWILWTLRRGGKNAEHYVLSQPRTNNRVKVLVYCVRRGFSVMPRPDQVEAVPNCVALMQTENTTYASSRREQSSRSKDNEGEIRRILF